MIIITYEALRALQDGRALIAEKTDPTFRSYPRRITLKDGNIRIEFGSNGEFAPKTIEFAYLIGDWEIEDND